VLALVIIAAIALVPGWLRMMKQKTPAQAPVLPPKDGQRPGLADTRPEQTEPSEAPAPNEVVYAKTPFYCIALPGPHTGVLKKEIDRSLQDFLTRAARELGATSDPRAVAVPPAEYLLFEEDAYAMVEKGPPKVVAPLAIKLGQSLGADMDRVAESLLGQRVTVTISPDGKVQRMAKAK
jgi:hypothetical protein